MAHQLPDLPYGFDALEPHIDNYHTSEEISAKKDIMDTYRVIEQYFNLEKG